MALPKALQNNKGLKPLVLTHLAIAILLNKSLIFMTQLTPIRLSDGIVIYIETTEGANTVPAEIGMIAEDEEEALTEKGFGADVRQKLVDQSFQSIEETIRAYTTYTLNAFKQLAIANVDKVTLEFGIKVAGEAGVPYVTKGTAESNLKITVECSFPKSVNETL